MIEIEELLTTHLNAKASAIEPQPDLRGVLHRAPVEAAAVYKSGTFEDPTRRPRPTRMFVALATLALVCAGIIALRANRPGDRKPTTTTSPGFVPAPSNAQPLLAPPGDQALSAGIIDIPPGRFSTEVRSPSGAIYTINITENFQGLPPDDASTQSGGSGADLPKDNQARTIGDHVVRMDSDGADQSYSILEPCSRLSISESAAAPAWPTDIEKLLGLATVDHGRAEVPLPVGWAIVTPTAELTRIYSVTDEHGVDGKRTLIYSMIGSSASAMFGSYGSPLNTRRADFDGHHAWFSSFGSDLPTSANRLTWEIGGNVYDVGAQGATQDQLIAYARSLGPTSVEELRSRAGTGWSDGGIVQETTPPGVTCQDRTLIVQEGTHQ
jgi:hypothetical protein